MKMGKQAWIYSKWVDSMFILSPPFVSLIVVFLFYPFFQDADVPVAAWVVLILLIDVAHVYTTLYRTYFDKASFDRYRSLLINIPLICWITGVLLYETDPVLFWRCLAYLAVYHFIRQQYGFMRIYSRNEKYSSLCQRIDNLAIYSATIYPVIYWHTHAPRNFHWFIENDFYYFDNSLLSLIALIVYLLIIVFYIGKEIYVYRKYAHVNVPKNLIVIGTFISWFFGIVYFNADLIFTTLNVVSHGIPYMALVWIYGKKKYQRSALTSSGTLSGNLFRGYGLVLFLLIVFTFAYLEEGLWDGFVWRDHSEVFPLFSALPLVNDKHFMAILVPLLSLPQMSHYVIDGFIWRLSKDAYEMKKAF